MNTFGVTIFNKDSMIILFNREEEFNMRACPEASNHSRYLAWDMQVLKEQAFHGSDAIAFVEEEEYAAL